MEEMYASTGDLAAGAVAAKLLSCTAIYNPSSVMKKSMKSYMNALETVLVSISSRSVHTVHTLTVPSTELVSSVPPFGCTANEHTTPPCALKRLTTCASTRSQ